jgi:uncharacterized protein (DUF952 family)
MPLIIHIVPQHQWTDAQAHGSYQGDTLATEGFIHCSTPAQTLWVANGRFRGREDLLLLCIDADRLTSELHYEESEPGQHFPHIYGPLNLDAVVAVVPFVPKPDGSFTMPDEVATIARTAN